MWDRSISRRIFLDKYHFQVLVSSLTEQIKGQNWLGSSLPPSIKNNPYWYSKLQKSTYGLFWYSYSQIIVFEFLKGSAGNLRNCNNFLL